MTCAICSFDLLIRWTFNTPDTTMFNPAVDSLLWPEWWKMVIPKKYAENSGIPTDSISWEQRDHGCLLCEAEKISVYATKQKFWPPCSMTWREKIIDERMLPQVLASQRELPTLLYGWAESNHSKTQLFQEIKSSNCGLVIEWNHQGMISQWFMVSLNHRPMNEVDWCGNHREGNDGEAQQLFWDVISAFVKIYTLLKSMLAITNMIR